MNNGGTSDDVIDYDTTTILLNRITGDYQTLLNPDNMQSLYELYAEGMYSSIEFRYNLNQKQADWMYGYLENLIEKLLC